MEPYTTEQFMQLEANVWAALKAGDATADAAMLADNFLGVYSSGFADKADHTGQLQKGPTVAHYELSQARIMVLAKDIVLLSYYAQWTRWKSEVVGGKEAMYVTSIWQYCDEVWKNVFSQDTPESL